MSLFKRHPEAPSGLVAEAAANPGGYVYEIDSAWVDDPNGYVPPEAVRGGWRVDDAGKLTDEYVPNPNHAAPHDELSALTTTDHYLGWLGADPGRTLRDLIEEQLADQVPGAKVEWLKFTDEPKVVTNARPLADEPKKMQLLRAAIAVQFGLSVKPPEGQRTVLVGVFCLALTGMEDPETSRQRAWLDLGTTVEEIGAQLEGRLRDLEA